MTERRPLDHAGARALEVAAAARERVDAHEDFCKERDAKIHQKIADIGDRVDRGLAEVTNRVIEAGKSTSDKVAETHKRIDGIIWAVISGMGAMLLLFVAGIITIITQLAAS